VLAEQTLLAVGMMTVFLEMMLSAKEAPAELTVAKTQRESSECGYAFHLQGVKDQLPPVAILTLRAPNKAACHTPSGESSGCVSIRRCRG
jgi:hypothetical protein